MGYDLYFFSRVFHKACHGVPQLYQSVFSVYSSARWMNVLEKKEIHSSLTSGTSSTGVRKVIKILVYKDP